jgi:hypothetical protein
MMHSINLFCFSWRKEVRNDDWELMWVLLSRMMYWVRFRGILGLGEFMVDLFHWYLLVLLLR